MNKMSDVVSIEKNIDKIHKIDLEMLIELDRICRKNNIKYTLLGGTLLGAVRNGGFIPWDEDADIAMIRSEYKKFMVACKNDLNKKKFFLQDHTTDPHYIFGYGKFRRLGTTYTRVGQESLKQKDGIFIDIFIRDNVPDIKLLRWFHCIGCFTLKNILNSKIKKETARSMGERLSNKLLSLVRTDFIFGILEKIAALCNKKNTRLCRSYTYTPYRGYGEPRFFYNNYTEIKFEGHSFMVVKEYKEFLKHAFGKDYMNLPSKEQQKPHLLIANLSFGNIYRDEDK